MKSPRLWRCLPLSRQLLISVNSVLIVVLAIFLVVDYRLRLAQQLEQTRLALTEEAKTLYESALALDANGPTAVQRLVDNVCARMNTEDSPGHHIATRWYGNVMQAISHERASPEMFDAMTASADGGSEPQPMTNSIVVGYFEGPAGAVYVSEQRSNIITTARAALMRQLIAVLIIGAIAGLVVIFMLHLVVTKPMRKLVTTLQDIGAGKLETRTANLSCRELRYFADQINAMAGKLDAAEGEHRLAMTKAREIQQNLRPSEIHVPQLMIDAMFEPAEDVGGDYYDVIVLNRSQVLLCVADVAGHGVPAAMAATLLKAFVSEAAKISSEPAEILNRVNRQYCEYVMSGHFATMVLVRIDLEERQLVYANAGHEWPFLQCGTEPVRRLEVGDLLLGVERDTSYEQALVQICSGTNLVLVSDGVTEAFNHNDDQFGTQRVEKVIAAGVDDNAVELTKRFARSLSEFRAGKAAFDDTTLLVAEFRE